MLQLNLLNVSSTTDILYNNDSFLNPESCVNYTCTSSNIRNENICAIKKETTGYRVRHFLNECYLDKYNCALKNKFTKTDNYMCKNINIITKDDNAQNRSNSFEEDILRNASDKFRNLIIVNSSFLNYHDNINDTIDEFFAATHFYNFPLQDVTNEEQSLDDTRRRMRINILRPIKIFKPYVYIPNEIKDDYDHLPLLSSCMHKCPEVKY